MKVNVVRGKPGQFDVVVDGVVIASRGGGFLKRVLGGGWPDPAHVVDTIEELQKKGGEPRA